MSARAVHDEVERAYEDARDDVYYYLLTLGLTPAEAQDTAQEVFLKLYTALRGGEAIRNVRAWVFRVAHNTGLNAKTRARVTHPVDELRLAGASNPEREAIANQRDALLRAALAELSPQQRQCLHLRAEGLRYHEIAAALGVSVSTVNEFVRRGLARLKKVLA